MKKLEHFALTQRALERGLWYQRQSHKLYDTSQKLIEQSMQVIQDASALMPTTNNGEK